MPDDTTPIMPTTPPPAGSTSAPAPSRFVGVEVGEKPGDQIDRYRLMEVVGEGGFGVVFLAEQTAPVRRRVALKVLKPGMDTKGVVARFEAERQALALMDHPHIAKVFDAGATPTGRPYFVMEYVPGVAITEHCDRHRLTIAQRLELFALVCDAVAHAHTKGVIHRDLKPTNILVSVVGDKPTPKIIDFGIAKAAQTSLAQQTIFTEHGQLIGTVEYMSPEQADLSHQDIDTRSDVYSLGVILYEVLIGAVPFDPQTLRARGLAEMRRVIRESEPPRPSTRLTAQGAGAEKVAEDRRLRLDDLARELRRELEWIPLRALRKDRTERYRSAQDLGDDVRRYLRGEPLLAGPDGAGYRLRKFVKRNRGPVAAVGAVALAVVLGLVGTIWMARRASDRAEGERLARIEAEEATKQSDLRRAEAEEARASLVRQMEIDRQRRVVDHVRRLANTDPGLMRLVLREAAFADNGRVLGERAEQWLERSDDRLVRRLPGHVFGAFCVAFSPDGRWAATGDPQGLVHLWRIDGSEPDRVLKGHTGTVNWVAFSPDGRHVASASRDASVRVWPLSGGEPIVLAGHTQDVVCVEFSGNGRLVLSAAEDNTARVWTLDGSAECVVRDVGDAGGLTWAAFSPNADRIAVASNDGRVLVWPTIGDGQAVELKSTGDQMRVVQFSPDGKRVLGAGAGRSAYIWSADGRGGETVIAGHKDGLYWAEFSPDGRRVVTASLDTTACVWTLDQDLTPLVLGGHTRGLSGARFSPDGEHVLTFSDDGTARLFRSDDPRHPVVLTGHDGRVWWGAFSPDGQHVITVGEDDSARLWRVRGVSEPATCWAEFPDTLATSADGRCVAFMVDGVGVRVWRPGDLDQARTVFAHETIVSALKMSPDGQRLIVSAAHEGAWVWCVETKPGGRTYRIDTPLARYARMFAFSPDGGLLAHAGDDHTVCVIDMKTNSLHARWSKENVSALSFSHDGRRVAWVTAEGELKICRVDGAAPDVQAPTNMEGVKAVAFSRDDAMVYVMAPKTGLHVFDAHTGAFKSMLSGPHGWTGLTVPASGPRVLAADAFQSVFVWGDTDDHERLIEVGSPLQHWESAEFVDRGRRLATITTEGAVRIYQVGPEVRRAALWHGSEDVLTMSERVEYLDEHPEVAKAREVEDRAWVAACRRARREGSALPEPPSPRLVFSEGASAPGP